MANSRGDREESVGSQRIDQFVNLDRSPSITIELVYSKFRMTLVEVTRDQEVMYHMNRRNKTLGWRLTIYVNDSDVECTLGRIEHLPQAKALSQKEIEAISKDLEILRANLL